MNDLVNYANQINREHELTDQHALAAVDHARRAGDLLVEAKARVPRGDWIKWLEQNVTVTPRTVQNYMKLSIALPKLYPEEAKRVSHLPLRKALATISINSNALADIDPNERSEVIEKLEGGQRVPQVLGELRRKKQLESLPRPVWLAVNVDGDQEISIIKLDGCRWHISVSPNPVGAKISPIQWNEMVSEASRHRDEMSDLTCRKREAKQKVADLAEALKIADKELQAAKQDLHKAATVLLENEHGIPQWGSYHWTTLPQELSDYLSGLSEDELVSWAPKLLSRSGLDELSARCGAA